LILFLAYFLTNMKSKKRVIEYVKMLLKNVNFKYIFFHYVFTVIVFIIKFELTGEFNFEKWICLKNIIILLLF
jgi:hypothetical protein